MALTSVFITGMGIVSPIGIGAENFWKELVLGSTGLREIPGLTDRFPSRVAGLVPSDQWKAAQEQHLPRRVREFYNKSSQMALVAAKEAQENADLWDFDPEKLGVAIGQSIEDHDVQRKAQLSNPKSFYEPVDDFDETVLIRSMLSAPTAALITAFGAEGPRTTLSNACVSGISALIQAARFIITGEADIVLAGATEAPLTHDVFQGLTGAKLLTPEIRSKYSVRPFDRSRIGSTIGEGAAIFVVESEKSIKRRSATPICRITSYADINEITTIYHNPDDTGTYWAKSMNRASPRIPDAINCHAPAGPIDLFEARGIQRAFPHDYRSIPVFSTKGQTGSGLAAGSALQSAASIFAIWKQLLPGTRNFRWADPEIPLNVNRRPQKRTLTGILQNAYGSGGAIASIFFEPC